MILILYLPNDKQLAGVRDVRRQAEGTSGYRSSRLHRARRGLVGKGIGSNGNYLKGSERKGYEVTHHEPSGMNSVSDDECIKII